MKVWRSSAACSSRRVSGNTRCKSGAATMPSKVANSPVLIFFCNAPRVTPTRRAARDSVSSCGMALVL